MSNHVQRWEYGFAPITASGEEWVIRSEEECDRLIAEHTDPRHYIHEEHNTDMSPVVSKRRYRRLAATEWEQVGE